jgi:hypothetical protein
MHIHHGRGNKIGLMAGSGWSNLIATFASVDTRPADWRSRQTLFPFLRDATERCFHGYLANNLPTQTLQFYVRNHLHGFAVATPLIANRSPLLKTSL